MNDLKFKLRDTVCHMKSDLPRMEITEVRWNSHGAFYYCEWWSLLGALEYAVFAEHRLTLAKVKGGDDEVD